MRETAVRIVKTLQNAGHQAVFAGGCVRDKLLGVESKDIDIATSATPDQVEQLFPRTVSVGKAFGVIIVLRNGFEFEIATFRKDSETGDGRHPDSVEFSSMKEDAERRDLTINALFEDPVTGEIFDFVNGREDLLNKKIRFVGDPNKRIEEDALRILRAIRFACRFDSALDTPTILAISDNIQKIDNLSKERIFDEMTKILHTRNLRKAMPILLMTGLLNKILPELLDLQACEQGAPWHCEGNVLEHTLLVLENLPTDASDTLLWGALLHDIGKPKTVAPSKHREGSFSFYSHELVGAKMIEPILKDRFKCSTKFVQDVTSLVKNHMQLRLVKEFKLSTLRKFLAQLDLDSLIQLGIADEKGGITDSSVPPRTFSWVNDILEARETLGTELPKPLVTGDTLIGLGMTPSPLFTKILKLAFNWQLEGVKEEVILQRVKGIS